jgi:glutamine amidotransferase
MQLFTRRSEEGERPGLGWIEAETVRFRTDRAESSLKVPHMGWNLIEVCRPNPLFAGLDDEPRFYFVHSYHVARAEEQDVVARTRYGYAFPSALGRGNILGTQFHPEKSHRFGIQLFRNFVERF